MGKWRCDGSLALVFARSAFLDDVANREPRDPECRCGESVTTNVRVRSRRRAVVRVARWKVIASHRCESFEHVLCTCERV